MTLTILLIINFIPTFIMLLVGFYYFGKQSGRKWF